MKSFKQIIVFFIVTLLSGYVLANEENNPRFFAENLCLQVKFFQGQPLSDLALLTKLGVKWVREEDRWHLVEAVPGRYKPFSASLQKRLAFYKAYDIGVIFILGYENPEAYPNTAKNPANFVNIAAYANYAAHMATMLKASGVKFKLELWNEPHNAAFAKKEALGGQWHGKPPSPWVDHYMKMVAAAVKAIKSVDPQIQVMVNDDLWIIQYFFLDKGLPAALDGLSVHPYNGGRPPEITAVQADTEWTKPYQVVDKDRSFSSAVRRLKSHAKLRMGKVPRLWITEWGWRVGEKAPDGAIVSAERIADYLPRAFILAEAAGVESTCWFSAQDVVDGEMGLKTNDGELRPAFYAYQQLSRQLAEKAFVGEIKAEKRFNKAFLFKGKTDWVVTTWRTAADADDQAVHYQKITRQQHVPTCIN